MDDPIVLANRQVPFPLAARWCDIELPDYIRESGIKLHCPFEDYSHEDGGAAPAFRVYPDHAFCFAEWKWFTSVTLYAAVYGILEADAALQLLDRVGYKPASFAHHWAQVSSHIPEPDKDALSRALVIWCRANIPGWDARQYDPSVSVMLGRVKDLLDLVQTPQDCDTWLAAGKKIMLAQVREGGEVPCS